MVSPGLGGEGMRVGESLSSATGSSHRYHEADLTSSPTASPNSFPASDALQASQQTIRPRRLERTESAPSPVQLIRQDFLGEWLTKEKPDSVIINLQEEYKEDRSMSSANSWRKVEPFSPSTMESIEERDYAILERKRRRDLERTEKKLAGWRGMGARSEGSTDRQDDNSTVGKEHRGLRWWERKKWWFVGGLAVVGIAIAVALGVMLKRTSGKLSQTQVSPCVSSPPLSLRLLLINLNASTTCVAHVDSFGGTQQIARGLFDVARNATALFSPYLDPTRLSTVVQRYSTLPTTTGNCTAQLSLVGPLDNLPLDRFPRRRAWTQAAVLWNIAMTESSAPGLLAFASSLNFSSLPDSPAPPDPTMQITSFGYRLDFSALSLSIPSSLTTAGSLSPSAREALDRINTNAVAASTQRGNALAHQWTELDLPLTSLPPFLSAIQRAPIVIPLDWNKVANLSNGVSFPPAAACTDSLTLSQTQSVNALETNAFGLAPLRSSTQNCSVDRPTYGILNLLYLRLPYADSDTRRNLPKQGIVLAESVKSRCSFHAGELLDIYGAATSPSSPSLPDRFGTSDNLQHVVLAYLALLDRSLAKLLVEFVLQSGSTPLESTSTLYTMSKQLALLPVMSVQVWGGVRRTDVVGAISSIASNDGSSLFYGSDGAQEWRRWIGEGNTGAGIAWSGNAMSREVLLDNSLSPTALLSLRNEVTTTTSPASFWERVIALGLAS